jgi:hypothetical protein
LTQDFSALQLNRAAKRQKMTARDDEMQRRRNPEGVAIQNSTPSLCPYIIYFYIIYIKRQREGTTGGKSGGSEGQIISGNIGTLDFERIEIISDWLSEYSPILFLRFLKTEGTHLMDDLMDGFVDLSSVGIVERKPEPEGTTALGLLQAVYRNPEVPLPARMKAAVECLPFESPKLSATAVLTAEDFGDRLEQAIARSGVRMSRTIDAKAVALPHPE